MFHHVVVFTFKPGTGADQVQEVIERLRRLPSEIPEIRDYQLGVDAGLDETNYDLAIVARFDSEADYLVYRDAPVHRQVVTEMVRPLVLQRAAVQFGS